MEQLSTSMNRKCTVLTFPSMINIQHTFRNNRFAYHANWSLIASYLAYVLTRKTFHLQSKQSTQRVSRMGLLPPRILGAYVHISFIHVIKPESCFHQILIMHLFWGTAVRPKNCCHLTCRLLVT